MAIPKKIHYCWFGRNEIPEKTVRCIESWKKYCPDYEIIQWNENNYDINKIRYMKDAYKEKKWAFVSDYARLDVIYQYGGIYLDTDVELVNSLDDLLEYDLFFAVEKQNKNINTGLGFGGKAKHIVLRENMEIYKNISFYNEDGSLNLVSCPEYTTSYFKQKGYKVEDKTQKIDDVIIFSSEYFCPIDFQTGEKIITEKTYGIHWYDATWFPESDKKIHDIEKKIRHKFPQPVAKVICFVYRKSYRFFEYLKDGNLLENINRKMRKNK